MSHPDPLLERSRKAIADLLVIVAEGDLSKVEGDAQPEVSEAIATLHDLRAYLAVKVRLPRP